MDPIFRPHLYLEFFFLTVTDCGATVGQGREIRESWAARGLLPMSPPPGRPWRRRDFLGVVSGCPWEGGHLWPG